MANDSKHMTRDSRLLIKVCGMRDPENIDCVCETDTDYLGYIFQRESSRYVGREPDQSIFDRVPSHIKKVGVFVNEEQESLVRLCRRHGLAAAQLHGNETPMYCRAVKKNGLMIIKAVSLHDTFNFSSLESYIPVTDYFLFDNRGKLRGGTGIKFNWKILDRYHLPVPFFLSGGIGPGDAAELKKLDHPQLFAIDINSGFETRPALKDTGAVRQFIHEIKKSNES